MIQLTTPAAYTSTRATELQHHFVVETTKRLEQLEPSKSWLEERSGIAPVRLSKLLRGQAKLTLRDVVAIEGILGPMLTELAFSPAIVGDFELRARYVGDRSNSRRATRPRTTGWRLRCETDLDSPPKRRKGAMKVFLSPAAKTALMRMASPACAQEARDVCAHHLEVPAREVSGQSGKLTDLSGAPLYWRRLGGGDVEDLYGPIQADEDGPDEAHNWVALYRKATTDECINYRFGRNTLIVVDIVENRVLAAFVARVLA